jgi:hypothetical protein
MKLSEVKGDPYTYADFAKLSAYLRRWWKESLVGFSFAHKAAPTRQSGPPNRGLALLSVYGSTAYRGLRGGAVW